MNKFNLPQYDLIEEHPLADISSTGYVFRHKKSGARIAVISNEDDNKVFSIGFRTPPEDETGVPHIIEHTVLCGSDKYPVKDPFIELVKGSLNTFLNAMTYPDKTLYPVASYNDQDYRNLMDVYLDAVFHPNITKYEEIFKQEGWHYELESEDAPLIINGVVYNEMKGAYSSADEMLQNQISRALFPDNTYSKDSGGNPEHIPELTYENYLAFYHRYYHPSNSYIYLYGDLDVEERLNYLDREYLSHYDYLQVDSEIPLQAGFDKVAEVEAEYPVMDDEPLEKSTYLSYNKVVGTNLDNTLVQAFSVLEYALVNAPGAPVRKALIDAGIGEDVYGSYDDGVRQPVFSFIAKNAEKEDQERFVALIEQTLKDLVENGLDHEALLAGINSNEFRFREADFGQFPKGLLYGLSSVETWIYDEKAVFTHIEVLETLSFLREQIENGYFEELIQKYLLDNTHGAVVVISPKRGMNKQAEQALAEKLERYKQSLSEEEKQALIESTHHLHAYQEEPSNEEDLKKIPMLSRSDMKKEAMPFSNIGDQIADVSVVRHEVETNGIDYMTLMFDVKDIPQEDLPYLGLLRSVIGYMDTAEHSYSGLANAINIYTGGITSSVSAYPDVAEPGKIYPFYEIRIKVLHSQLQHAMDLTDEMLRTTDVTDEGRLAEIIAQVKSRLQVSLSSSGNSVAAMRALSYQSSYAFYQDATSGIAYYRLIQQLDRQMKEEPKQVAAKIASIMGQLLTRARLTLSLTMTASVYGESKTMISDYLKRLPAGEQPGAAAEYQLEKKNEGFTDASQIQYVAKVGNFHAHGFDYQGTLKVLKVILNYDYLWTNIRVIGGAYGCGSAFLRTGESYFVSYRDPNLGKTLAVYDKIPEYVKNFDVDERDMTKYIIGTFGALDTPLNPEAKGSRSMAAYVEHLTFEDAQSERDKILAAAPKDIRALADMLAAVLSDDQICVIGNENAILAEKDTFLHTCSLN